MTSLPIVLTLLAACDTPAQDAAPSEADGGVTTEANVMPASSTYACETIEGEAFPDVAHPTQPFVPGPGVAEFMGAWGGRCAQLLDHEAYCNGSVTNTDRQMVCAAALSAITAQAESFGAETDMDDVADWFSTEIPDVVPCGPALGDDPGDLEQFCGEFADFSTGFACGSIDLTDAMTNTIQGYLTSLWGGTPNIQWLALDFTEPNPDPHQASLVWLAIIQSMHMQPPGATGGIPASLLFTNDSGTGAASILEVHMEVCGSDSERTAFINELLVPDGDFDEDVFRDVELTYPTKVRYRQGGQIRTWPGAEPMLTGDTTSSTPDTWALGRSFGLIDPCYYEKSPDAGSEVIEMPGCLVLMESIGSLLEIARSEKAYPYDEQ